VHAPLTDKRFKRLTAALAVVAAAAAAAVTAACRQSGMLLTLA